MALLAHLTTFDVPSLAVAFAAGAAIGAGVALSLLARRGR